MPRQSEPSVNNALGSILDRMLPTFAVRSEQLRQIVNRPALKPDVLITAPGLAPVAIEAEFMPARTAEG